MTDTLYSATFLPTPVVLLLALLAGDVHAVRTYTVRGNLAEVPRLAKGHGLNVALGAWLGWQQLPQIILLSAVVGALVGIALLVFRKHERSIPIPFGPYLAAAGWITMLWGDKIKTTYLDTML